MDMLKRVEKLESKILTDDEDRVRAIFGRVIDARKEAPPIEEQEKIPVIGWKMDGHKWIRQPGETDEALEERAIAEANELMRSMGRHPLAVPCFHQVMSDETESAQAQ